MVPSPSIPRARKEPPIPASISPTTLLSRILLCLAAVLFLVRGPLRAQSTYVNDLAAPYASARLWLHHRNPYDTTAFFPTWRAAGAPSGPVYANPSSIHPVYPPPSLVVLIPFAILPWPLANVTLTLLTALAYLTASLLFARLVPGTWSDPAKPVFLAYALALAPTHSAMHVSNTACLSASLLFIGIYRTLVHSDSQELLPKSSSRADRRTAALLTLSLCLKPTLAPIFLLFLLSRRYVKTLIATFLAGLALCAASLYPLLRQPGPWLRDLTSNIHFVFTQGTASLAETNLTRFDRIDLQLPLYALTHSTLAATLGTALITSILLAGWSLPSLLYPSNSPAESLKDARLSLDRNLLSIATLLLIGLLPIYQRFYSAVLVLPLALWSFRNLPRPAARWTLAVSCLFLLNTEVFQQTLGVLPPGSLHLTRVQNAFIGPHLNWILLLSVTALVFLLNRRTARP